VIPSSCCFAICPYGVSAASKETGGSAPATTLRRTHTTRFMRMSACRRFGNPPFRSSCALGEHTWGWNTSKHSPSSRGKHRQKLSPVAGSTAAYSHSHSYLSYPWRTEALRAPPASVPGLQQAEACLVFGRLRIVSGNRSSFKIRLFFFGGFSMATAPGLELNLVSLEQPRKTAHPFVMDAEVCSSKNSWTSSRRAISPAFIRSCKVCI
jgi:hypothetical protein